MIIDRNNLKTNFSGLVGFLQTSDPNYPAISSALLTSRSGLYVNDVHPLIFDIENIDQSVTNFAKFNYPAYNALTTYKLGQRVSFNGSNWIYASTTPSSGNTPEEGVFWNEVDELNEYLANQYEGGVDFMVKTWLAHKKVRNVARTFFDRILLFNGNPNYRDLVRNEDKFVGLRIEWKKGQQGLALILNQIGTHFTGEFSGLNIYVYHSSQQQPIATYTVDSTDGKTSEFKRLTSDNILRYWDGNQQPAGEYFIGYKQSELEAKGGQAIKFLLDLRGKSLANENYRKQCSPFINIRGFEIEESQLGEGNDMFDPDKVSDNYTGNYGLNLNLSLKNDIGQFMIENEDLFAEALQYSIGMKLMRALANSSRDGNSHANIISKEAKKEIYSSQGVEGTLYDEWMNSIKALNFDLSNVGGGMFPQDENFDPLQGSITLG